MKTSSIIMVILCLIIFSGCQGQLVRMSAENNMMETSISQKERELGIINEWNNELDKERVMLGIEHDVVQTDLELLSLEIEQLEELNAGTKAETDIQRKKLKDAEIILIELKQEVDDLSADNQLTDDARNEKILRLRSEIQTRLKMGLQ